MHELHANKNSRPSPRCFADRRSEKTSKREEQQYWLKQQRRVSYARRNFANCKTKTTVLRNPDRISATSRTGLQKVTHDFYWDSVLVGGCQVNRSVCRYVGLRTCSSLGADGTCQFSKVLK
ncbi:hypothetical protein RB195_024643 [Necator americanus]|uniref:Uncharacterized protein n=1 Tax=Necator americanus TaxID=51031 RepID=A0ABR1EP40_NECAM